MKKICTLLLALFCCFCSSVVVFASEEESKSIDLLLAPYLEVIDKVNSDREVKICIPEENKERVYEYYKEYSLEEFEKVIIEELNQTFYENIYDWNEENITIEEHPSFDNIAASDDTEERIVKTLKQSAPIIYNSTLYVNSTVLLTGIPLMYYYQSVNDVIVRWPSNYTGYHFHLVSWWYSFSNNNTACTIYTYGYPLNAAGLTLAVMLFPQVTFYAN